MRSGEVQKIDKCRVQNAELWWIFAEAKIFINVCEANISHLRSKYFTAKRFHPTESDFTVGKAHQTLHSALKKSYFSLLQLRIKIVH